MASFAKGAGEVFNAGTTEWAHGLAANDPFRDPHHPECADPVPGCGGCVHDGAGPRLVAALGPTRMTDQAAVRPLPPIWVMGLGFLPLGASGSVTLI